MRGGDRWCWILITSDQQLTRKLSLSGAEIPVAATVLCSVDMRGHSDITEVLLCHCVRCQSLDNLWLQELDEETYSVCEDCGAGSSIHNGSGPGSTHARLE